MNLDQKRSIVKMQQQNEIAWAVRELAFDVLAVGFSSKSHIKILA